MNEPENLEDWRAMPELASNEENRTTLYGACFKALSSFGSAVVRPRGGSQMSHVAEGRVLPNERSRGWNRAS